VLTQQLREEHLDLAGSERFHETRAVSQSVRKRIDGTTRHYREGDDSAVEHGCDRDKNVAAEVDADERSVEQFVPRQLQRLLRRDNQPVDVEAESSQKLTQMISQQDMIFNDQHAPRAQQDGRPLPVAGRGLLVDERLESDEELLRSPMAADFRFRCCAPPGAFSPFIKSNLAMEW
jgi:hypothetical protein